MDEYPYALERLYEDQEYDWVADSVPAVMAWLPGRQKGFRSPPFRVGVTFVAPRALQISLALRALEIGGAREPLDGCCMALDTADGFVCLWSRQS